MRRGNTRKEYEKKGPSLALQQNLSQMRRAIRLKNKGLIHSDPAAGYALVEASHSSGMNNKRSAGPGVRRCSQDSSRQE
eukprot:1161802-Pelagomonas_calceolata.AAC.4